MCGNSTLIFLSKTLSCQYKFFAGSNFTLSRLMTIISEVQDLRNVTKEIKAHEKVNLEVVSSPGTHETSKEATNTSWHHLREIFKQCHELGAVDYMELHTGIANKQHINVYNICIMHSIDCSDHSFSKN